MVSLLLEECKSCERLPPLGLLPFLKVLRILRLDGIVSIDGDFYGNNSSSFKSLQTLEFLSLSRWENWDCQAVTGAFPRLRRLSITYCGNLKGQLPEQLIPLETLNIKFCQQLEASAPRALDLQLTDCGKLQLQWGTMKSLTLCKTSLLEIGRSNTLENLLISSLWESINDDYVSPRSFPLDLCPTLRTFDMIGYGNLQMISQSLVHNHLEELRLDDCRKFESFPGSMHMLLPSLRSLQIKGCSVLESFPEGGFPSNLLNLRIERCPRLKSFPVRGFPSNLKILTIQGCSVLESFPGFPSNLLTLIIEDCPRLKSFPVRGFPSNLENLTIQGCSVLESFPDGGFPSNLQTLRIQGCPVLESFPDRGFPLNLKDLRIFNCSRLVGSLKEAFTNSSSFKRLYIGGLDAECFPDEGLLPLSLTSLTISRCPNLEKLDYKGLHQLSSLKKLNLFNCPNLQGLPEEGLPKSISELSIHGCPLLNRRCRKERGEDWKKIAHIQKLCVQ